MRFPIARSLAALLAFALAAPAASRADERGAAVFVLCTQCHGDAGEGNQAFGAPAIAGLPLWYVQSQLLKFRSGLRGRHFDDLEGMRMRPMSLTLRKDKDGNDVDVDAVASHVAALPPVRTPATVSGGDAARGATLYAQTCASCHGVQGQGSQDQSAPPVVGMSDWYLLSSLQKFKDGVRGGDLNDMTAVMMRPMAMALEDQQAMKDIIAHIATFPK
jgi:cytochrome c oxidase subunit 2